MYLSPPRPELELEELKLVGSVSMGGKVGGRPNLRTMFAFAVGTAPDNGDDEAGLDMI
jgi:hypothetical protein